MKYNQGDKLIDVIKFEMYLFSIDASTDKFIVEWRPHVYEAIRQPRYLGWFSALDLVRTNAQTTLNARLTTECRVEDVGPLISRSIASDMNFNHAVRQCFMELGL